jgi:hypothetical protein
VPESAFEAAVESERPPGTNHLAQMGRVPRQVKVEPVTTLTEAVLSDMGDRHAAGSVLDLLLRLEAAAGRADMQRVIDILLDEANIDRLPKVRLALSYARQLQAGLDKRTPSKRLTLVRSEDPAS